MTKPTEKPLVSIITALYNAENYIIENLNSVQLQTYENWEHIIVDDSSTDGSIAIVEQYVERDKRIKLITLTSNGGAAQARNRATEEAKGTYITFLDADDLWHPEKLSRQIIFMNLNNCAVSYTSYIHIDSKGDCLGRRIKAMPTLSFKKQRKNNYIGNLTGAYNVAQIGKIMTLDIRKRQDWALWLEAIKRAKKPALGIQEDLAYYRKHNTSMSSSKLNLVKYNYLFYRSYLGYSTVKSALFLLAFFWEYFVKRNRWIENYQP